MDATISVICFKSKTLANGGASAHVAHYERPQTDDEEFRRVGASV